MRQAWVQPAAPPGQLVERAGLADDVRGRSPVVEPALQLGGQHAGAVVVGYVGHGAAGGQAVEVHEVAHPVRHAVGELHDEPAALRVADQWRGLVRRGVEHGEQIADVGVPRVQRGPVAVAVAALVPRHDSPPGLHDERRQQVPRGGEVEPAMDAQHRRCGGFAPLVHGQAEAVGIDPAGAVRAPGTGERGRRRLAAGGPGLGGFAGGGHGFGGFAGGRHGLGG